MTVNLSASGATADDLLVLLAVARSGRYTTAARQLGVTHTTIARRISALERALGGRVLVRGTAGWQLTPLGGHAAAAGEHVESALSQLDGDGAELRGAIRLSATDGFSAYIAAPAMAALRRRHPGISLQIVTKTRHASLHRSGVDLEVVVGRPEVRNAKAVRLADYALGLYASREFLAGHGTPGTFDELAGAPLVYFIESMLQVDALDDARQGIPDMIDAVTSTNVFVHVEATLAGAGFGLLPCFLADRETNLVRVLPDQVEQRLPYWLIAPSEVHALPVVAAYLDALRERLDEVRPTLLGEARASARARQVNA
ncbi:LysR family transcriptional regulator [Salinibacterium sp. G-O1]|uniref:LysR family transcriptional regulator n=1 Tax=Salinibacterium sp. G-O1 TaxID=3046208 RepID=UPI0024B87AFE|nr:LysR family transcriptional regulator [Salinibacterium sp. G-O1]MDJ0335036.1 LysR family transcriptional regulator [Salinibacterium sp. G-O1]